MGFFRSFLPLLRSKQAGLLGFSSSCLMRGAFKSVLELSEGDSLHPRYDVPPL